MSLRDRIKRARLRMRMYRLRMSIKIDDLRIWWATKRLAYLKWKRDVYERHKVLSESREFQEGDDER